jgi:hypothetical protein
MAHRDWKGEGYYHCWDGDEWLYLKNKTHESGLARNNRYQKEEDFIPPEPPKPPKPELEDGLYLWQNTSMKGGHVDWACKIDGKWARCLMDPEDEVNEHIKIIGRIPVEPGNQEWGMSRWIKIRNQSIERCFKCVHFKSVIKDRMRQCEFGVPISEAYMCENFASKEEKHQSDDTKIANKMKGKRP